jgi:hypothetical protein
MLKRLVRKEEDEGRGVKTPALIAARMGLLGRLGSMGRWYALAGAGVVAAAVLVVSLLSWLAPNSDKPISHPLEVVVKQVVALIGADEETVPSSAREGVTAAGSKIPWAGERLREIATNRSASAGPVPVSAARQTPTTAAPWAPRSAAPMNESSAPQATREPSRETSLPSPPSSTSSSPSSSTGEAAPPAAAEEPPPTSSEPPSSPPPPTTETPLPAAEEPSTAPAEESPPIEEPSTPPREEPPPTTEESPPTQNQPPPPTNQLPPIIVQPPPPPTGER